MTEEPAPSEEAVFTTPPSRLFQLRLTPKVRILTFLLLGLALSVMPSAICFLSLAGELSGLERDEIFMMLFLCAGLGFGGSAVLFFLDINRQRRGLLRLDPDAIRWHESGSEPVKLPYADLWSARRVDEMLVLQGGEGTIKLPAGAFEDPGAIETILQDISTRIAELSGGGPQDDLPLTDSRADDP